MASAQEFIRQLLRIPGIRGYCLMRADGRLLVHNLAGAEEQAALVHICGQAGAAIRKGMGLQHFRHLTLMRRSGEHLLVFPVEHYLLGIVQTPETATPELVETVSRFLLRITRTPREADGPPPGRSHVAN